MKVLFLPGVGGDPMFWRPLANSLPRAWDKVLFGWPGLGAQPRSPAVNSFDDLLAMVERCIDRPVALVAQSMGGMLALRAALRHRQLVTRLVLTATSGGIDLAPFGAADWRNDYRREYPDAAEWVYQRGDSVEAELSTLDIPALLLWATRDPLSPAPVGRHLASLLPQARLIELDDDNHMFARDRAAEIASLIQAHLEVEERPR